MQLNQIALRRDGSSSSSIPVPRGDGRGLTLTGNEVWPAAEWLSDDLSDISGLVGLSPRAIVERLLGLRSRTPGSLGVDHRAVTDAAPPLPQGLLRQVQSLRDFVFLYETAVNWGATGFGEGREGNANCFIAWLEGQTPPAFMRIDAEERRDLLERRQCLRCPATLASAEGLRAHVASVHGAARFHCFRCDAGFKERQNLVDHRENLGACDKNPAAAEERHVPHLRGSVWHQAWPLRTQPQADTQRRPLPEA